MLSAEAFDILDLVTEDSYGLWEIAAVFKDRHRDRTASKALSLAQATAIELLADGLVALWSQPDVGSEEVLVPPEVARAALMEGARWEWPTGPGPMLRLLATEAGIRAYYSS